MTSNFLLTLPAVTTRWIWIPDITRTLGFGGRVNSIFSVLPFGLASAPWCFLKIIRTISLYLRFWGVRLINYLYDFLFLVSDSQSTAHRQLVLELSNQLAWQSMSPSLICNSHASWPTSILSLTWILHLSRTHFREKILPSPFTSDISIWYDAGAASWGATMENQNCRHKVFYPPSCGMALLFIPW